jgi:hypothetical protein
VTDEPKLLAWALKLIDYPWDPDGAVRARHDFAAYLKPFLDERRVNPATTCCRSWRSRNSRVTGSATRRSTLSRA